MAVTEEKIRRGTRIAAFRDFNQQFKNATQSVESYREYHQQFTG